jgi:hypothetical protein
LNFVLFVSVLMCPKFLVFGCIAEIINMLLIVFLKYVHEFCSVIISEICCLLQARVNSVSFYGFSICFMYKRLSFFLTFSDFMQRASRKLVACDCIFSFISALNKTVLQVWQNSFQTIKYFNLIHWTLHRY